MSSNLRNFFSIDEDQLIVQYSTSDKLDRDNGIPGIENTIIVEATDINCAYS